MESKTKHRILGIIVMAGIAVLMYPILQANTEKLPDEQQLVKAPPFPDQTIQVSTDTPDTDAMPTDYQVQDSNSLSAEAIAQPANLATPVPEEPSVEPVNVVQNNPGPMSSKDDHEQCVIIDIRPPHLAEAPTSLETETVAAAKKVAMNQKTKPKTKHKTTAPKARVAKQKKSHPAKKPVIYSKIHNQKIISAYRQQPLDDNGLLQLKNAAWVIQLGSFKDKTNALKLVNKLRSRGYRAFIQKYSATSGEHTRVFVGPEHQQKSARLVAAELKKGMKLHGIVISYKPFTL